MVDEWFKKYAGITPFVMLACTLLFWRANGAESWADLAGFVELGTAGFAAFVVAVDTGGNGMFYGISKIRKQ